MSTISSEHLKHLHQALFLEDQKSPFAMYRRTAEFFDELARVAGTPLAIALVARDSRMILPFLCHPTPPQEFQPFAELIEMTTIFSMQRYRLGSLKHTDPQDDDKTWFFDVITDPEVVQTGAFVRFRRTGDPRMTPVEDVPLREYSGEYELEVTDPSPAQRGTCSVYMPYYGRREHTEGDSQAGQFVKQPTVTHFQNCRVRAVRYAAHQTGAEVFLLIALPADPWADAEKSDQICTSAITGAFPLVDELRRQVSTANPRYVSRYYQVKLGTAVLDRVFSGTITPWDQSFLWLFLEEGRGHEVVLRRLLRYAHAEKTRWQQADALLKQLPNSPSYTPVRDYWKRLGQPPEDEGKVPSKGTKKKKGTKVVAVAAPRGGVGKTTVSYFLASRLAASGLKTCFVELDIADPTVYFVDEKLRKHLQNRADKGKGDDNPIAALWNTWVDDGRKGIQKVIGDLPFPKAVYSKEHTEHTKDRKKYTFDVFAAVPFEVSGRAAELLAAASSSKNHTPFLSTLVAALEESGKYDYVIVDTAAGLRDFSEAMINLKETNVVLMLAHPTKLSILSSLESFGHRPKGKSAKRLFVLNAARDIDRELFAGVEEVIDFCTHWSRNGGTGSTFKKMDQMVTKLRANCEEFCLIPWNEAWMRMEVNVDADDLPPWVDRLLDEFINKVRRAAEGDE